jgi:hypothetical protein
MTSLRATNVRCSERHAVGFLAVVLLASLLVTACTAPGQRLVLPVSFDEAPSAAPRYPDDFSSHEAVVRGVAAMLARDLGLPVPEHVTVYIYSSRDVFERGLVSDARLSIGRAAELSEFAVGVGQRRQLLLHSDGGAPAGRDWLRLIAHELTHVAQIELALSEGRAEQWLAEGMADWAAFFVLEQLGLDTLAGRRAAARREVRHHPALQAGRLELASLGTSRGFTLRHLREGSLPTYQLAFLMTDYLVRRHGFAALVDYFRSLTDGRERHEGFRLAFGRTLREFEREILDHFDQVLH